MRYPLIALSVLFAWTTDAFPEFPEIIYLAKQGSGFEAVEELIYGAAKNLTTTFSPLAGCTCNTPYTNPTYHTTYPAGITMSYWLSRDLYMLMRL